MTGAEVVSQTKNYGNAKRMLMVELTKRPVLIAVEWLTDGPAPHSDNY